MSSRRCHVASLILSFFLILLLVGVAGSTRAESSNERASTLSLLQMDLRLKLATTATEKQALELISPNCFPYYADNSTLVDRTCKPLQRPPQTSDTQSFCLCRRTEHILNLGTLIKKQSCPMEPTIASSFKHVDSVSLSLNSDFIAQHSHHDGNPYRPAQRLVDAKGISGILRFDISDGQVDVSPTDVQHGRSIPLIKIFLDVAKEVRLPNVSILLSIGDGSPDLDAFTMGINTAGTHIDTFKPASLGIWRTDGRPGVDLLSIPRSMWDWGLQVRSMFNTTPNATYMPKSFAVFRGGDTGNGWRQKIRTLASKRPDLLDAGYDFLTDEQQMRFQVVVAPDGLSLPDRLARQLAYGVPVVFVHPQESLNEFWYHEMQPWIHYVPSSGEDLELTLETLRNDPVLARQIGLNGQRFAVERLTERRLRCYMYRMLEEYSKRFKM